jgi:type III restriction enzyme
VDFASFLDKASDVVAFAKIVPKIGFFMEYRDSEGNLRFYYPDFIVKLTNGDYWVIETKGLEDVDVKHKDKRAMMWCEDATKLTKDIWSFVRINQELFYKRRFRTIKEILGIYK